MECPLGNKVDQKGFDVVHPRKSKKERFLPVAFRIQKMVVWDQWHLPKFLSGKHLSQHPWHMWRWHLLHRCPVLHERAPQEAWSSPRWSDLIQGCWCCWCNSSYIILYHIIVNFYYIHLGLCFYLCCLDSRTYSVSLSLYIYFIHILFSHTHTFIDHLSYTIYNYLNVCVCVCKFGNND